VRRFVFFSSSFVYGNFKYYPADEDHPLQPIDVYGETKYLGECLVREFCTEYKIPFTIVRPSAVYGYGDANRRVVQLFLENAMNGQGIELYDAGHSAVDFTAIEDLVDGVWRVLSNPKADNEVFNITRGRGRAIEQLAAIVIRHFPNVGTRVKSDNQKRPNRGPLDIAKSRTLLGYNPQIDLEEGVARYIHELKKTAAAQ
jgi:nucleoside-diphosphate-sugar epimerase